MGSGVCAEVVSRRHRHPFTFDAGVERSIRPRAVQLARSGQQPETPSSRRRSISVAHRSDSERERRIQRSQPSSGQHRLIPHLRRGGQRPTPCRRGVDRARRRLRRRCARRPDQPPRDARVVITAGAADVVDVRPFSREHRLRAGYSGAFQAENSAPHVQRERRRCSARGRHESVIPCTGGWVRCRTSACGCRR
jgi:hypothetical protein